MADLKRMNIRVTPQMHEWLTTNAEIRGISLNAMVIFALETYIQQQIVTPMLADMMAELKKQDRIAKEMDGWKEPKTSSD